MGNALLQVKNLKKSYGDHQVLNGINFKINPGMIVGLLGPNGCGKTSMIKSIVGLINDYEGEILIEGEHPGVESKKAIAYLPEKNYLPGDYPLCGHFCSRNGSGQDRQEDHRDRPDGQSCDGS